MDEVKGNPKTMKYKQQLKKLKKMLDILCSNNFKSLNIHTIILILYCGISATASDATNFFHVNLRPFCNMGFLDDTPDDRKGGWTDQGGSDLREFPTGVREFAKIPFDVITPDKNKGKSCVMLRGKARPYFAAEINIPIGRKVASLYFLHSGAWGGGGGASYNLIYADGTHSTRKLINKVNIADWAEPAPLSEAKLVWQGHNLSNAIGVWMMRWDNPFPDKDVSMLKLSSPGTGAVIGIIAITGSAQKISATESPLDGVIAPDSLSINSKGALTGNLRLKNRSSDMISGRILLTANSEKGEIARQYLDFRPQPIHKKVMDQCFPGENWDVHFSVTGEFKAGTFSLKAAFEPTGRIGELLALDEITVHHDRDKIKTKTSTFPLRGLINTDKFWFYRDEPVTGNIQLSVSAVPGIGRIRVDLLLGGRLLTQSYPEYKAQQVDFSVPVDYEEGLYRLNAWLELDSGSLIELDSVEFAGMGKRPSEPLTPENFLTYSEPLHLMIGYLHDDRILRAQFAEMRAKGFDLVALEWFWDMMNREENKPISLDNVKKVSGILEQAGLKLWMYYGLWNYFPSYAEKLVDANGRKVNALDLSDEKTRRELLRLYSETAIQLRDNQNVIGYTIRLHPNHYNSYSHAARKAWAGYLHAHKLDTPEKLKAMNINLAPDGLPQIPPVSSGNEVKELGRWQLFLKFEEQILLEAIEDICHTIRKYDSVKPIRLNFAQSYEAANNECPGFQQIGFYHLTEKYRGVINQECFEFPIHSSKEPQLSKKYGVGLTTEGGGVPMAKPGIATLMYHAIENNVAYVAYCHNLVRSNLFEWFRYKPFWKIRKRYGEKLCDNLTLTSFWKDCWLPDSRRGAYFQHHFNYNLMLLENNYAFEMVNEVLLQRGKISPGSVLFDTNSFHIGDETAKDIRNFIAKGGVFVANHLTGYNAWDGGEKYLLLRKYLGVKIKDERSGKVKCAAKTVSNRRGIALVIGPGDRILATWQDGAPAAIMRHIGKGKVLVIGFNVVKEDFANGIMPYLLSRAGVKRRLIAEHSREAMVAKDADGNYFIAAVNGDSADTKAKITINGLNPRCNYRVINLMTRTEGTMQTSAAGQLVFPLPIAGNACNFAEIREEPKP